MYAMDRTYAAGRGALDGGAVKRAWANHQSWTRRFGALTGQIQEWCATEALFGPDAQAALNGHRTAQQLAVRARTDVAEAERRSLEQRQRIGEAITRAVAGQGDLPDGTEAVAAESAVRAAELVSVETERAVAAAHQRWGRAIQRADWPAALEGAQRLDSDEARLAAVWIAAKLDPPLTPAADPAAWW
jgi:hypothetical protein